MTNREIAERIVSFIPAEVGSEDCGSITIGPHVGDEQCWQLWTRRSDEKSAIRARDQIRRWITAALDAKDAEQVEPLKCVRDNTASALRQAEAASALCKAHVVLMQQLSILASHAVTAAESNKATP